MLDSATSTAGQLQLCAYSSHLLASGRADGWTHESQWMEETLSSVCIPGECWLAAVMHYSSLPASESRTSGKRRMMATQG